MKMQKNREFGAQAISQTSSIYEGTRVVASF